MSEVVLIFPVFSLIRKLKLSNQCRERKARDHALHACLLSGRTSPGRTSGLESQTREPKSGLQTGASVPPCALHSGVVQALDEGPE